MRSRALMLVLAFASVHSALGTRQQPQRHRAAHKLHRAVPPAVNATAERDTLLNFSSAATSALEASSRVAERFGLNVTALAQHVGVHRETTLVQWWDARSLLVRCALLVFAYTMVAAAGTWSGAFFFSICGLLTSAAFVAAAEVAVAVREGRCPRCNVPEPPAEPGKQNPRPGYSYSRDYTPFFGAPANVERTPLNPDIPRDKSLHSWCSAYRPSPWAPAQCPV
jgi:hypothetical protein